MGLLSTLNVLDFSSLLPGPFATLALADMGANVIHVESPDRPDLMRFFPPLDNDGRSATHAHINRSKRALGVDLKAKGSVDVIKRLVKTCDIVVEQFRPGVMARLGLGYEALCRVNPGIIYCAVSGYGQTGPYRDRAGHDLNYMAVAGALSYNGRKSSGPAPMGLQAADIAGGSYHAVMAVLAAVIHRHHTGEGQYIDVSMTDAAFSMQATTLANAVEHGRAPGLEQDIFNGGTFYDCYETLDRRFMAVAGIEPHFFHTLCDALGLPGLKVHAMSPDPEIQAMIKEKIGDAIAKETLAHWTEVFQPLDACVEPVGSLTQALDHPQIRARELVVEVPDGDKIRRQAGFPVKFSGFSPEYKFTGADIGAHTREILGENGFSRDEIHDLETGRVVFGPSGEGS